MLPSFVVAVRLPPRQRMLRCRRLFLLMVRAVPRPADAETALVHPGLTRRQLVQLTGPRRLHEQTLPPAPPDGAHVEVVHRVPLVPNPWLHDPFQATTDSPLTLISGTLIPRMHTSLLVAFGRMTKLPNVPSLGHMTGRMKCHRLKSLMPL